MRKIAIGIATFLLAALYALCRLLPQQQRIVCISRQSDSAPVDFRLIKDYCERRDPPGGGRLPLHAADQNQPGATFR